MKLIHHQEFNKKIDQNFNYDFSIGESGLYFIEIIASAKSWWQNLVNRVSLFQDDDLIIKIDSQEFIKLNGKLGLFDGEVAWNGNNLKELAKVNIFIINFQAGNHTVKFLADQQPFLQSLKIFKIENLEKIIYVPEKNKAEDGDKRQWLNITLIDLPLKQLNIKAKADNYQGDDDDIKLIIDGKVQVNGASKAHKFWYWCGRILKGAKKEFSQEISLQKGLHYIELWADKTPTLKEVELTGFASQKEPIDFIQKYIYRGVNGSEDYNRFDEEIKYAVDFWNKFFSSQKYPPSETLDPNLIKALVYTESRMGYDSNGLPDVAQVWDEANNTPQTIKGDKVANEYIADTKVGHISYSYPTDWIPPKVESPRESIFWAVRWLYYKVQYLKLDASEKLIYPYVREWGSWEESLSGYNPRSWYKDRVLKIYQKGIDQNDHVLWVEKKQSSMNFKNGLIAFLLIVSIAGLSRGFTARSQILPDNFKIIKQDSIAPNNNLVILQDFASGRLGIALLDDESRLRKWLPKGKLLTRWEDQSLIGDSFAWWQRADINRDGLDEIAIQTDYVGPAQVKYFLLYQQNGDDFNLMLYFYSCAGQTEIKDLDNDGIKEIIHSFALDCAGGMAGRNLTQWKDVYVWRQGSYQKANQLFPDIYRDLLNYYQPLADVDVESFLSYQYTIECLTNKAKLNSMGVLADADQCDKNPIYVWRNLTIDDGISLVADLKIFSQKEATFDDGLYCGFRFNKIYESEAKLSLISGKKITDSINLTDPELVLPELSDEYADFYKPLDIDGDGKKQEFIIREYDSCNGDFISFVRVDKDLKKIEKIPIIHQDKEKNFVIFGGIGKDDVKISDGIIEVKYYNNGYFKDLYGYNQLKKSLILVEHKEIG